MIPPLVPIAVAYLLGVLVASSLSLIPSIPFVVGLSGVLTSLTARSHRRVSLIALLVLWVCIGMLRTTSWLSVPPSHVRFLVRPEPEPVLVHGVVVDDPVELFSPNEPERHVCVVRTIHVRTQDGWRVATGLLRARLQRPRLTLAYGDEVLLEGAWSSVRGPGNPGQFDWRAALARQRIHVLLSVEPHHGVVRLHTGHGRWWFRALYTLRHRLEALITEHFSAYHAGLLRSFLLGQRVALDEDLKQAFIETGTMHLVVISGFNVGLIAGVLELILRIAGLPLRLRLVTSSLALFGYCLLTGMQAPVMRATVMTWVVLGAIFLDRLINWPNTLAAAALAILCVNPMQLFDPGFQLSFGAVLSLLVFTSRFRTGLAPLVRIHPEWLQRYVAISLASTVAIWVGLWPLLAWYFYLVSPVSVLANLVLVPLVSLLVTSGTILLSLGTVAASVVQWTSPGFACLLDVTVGCVRWFHQIPFGFWPVGHPAWLLIAGYYGLVVLTLLRHRLRLSPGWVVVCWLIGLNVWLWGRIGLQAARSRWLEVTILDVGHGDSLVIRTPSQHTLLVDTGTQDAGQYAVVPFLRFNGFHTLDALVITHPDEDHLGGTLPLLRHVRMTRLLTNGSAASTQTAREVFRLVDARRLRPNRLAAGMWLTGAPGLDMIILHPPPHFVPGTAPSSNDNSVVIKITMGKVNLLLCGDLEERGLPWLMRWNQALQAQILKVPHHGSALGPWGRSFVEQVHPDVAVISVGRAHHLPSTEVLHDLAEVGAWVFLTRRDGAITLRTDGIRLEIRVFRGSRKWQPVNFGL